MNDYVQDVPAAQRSRLETIGGNAFWSLLRYGAGWIALLLLPPFLIHRMSTAQYGTWMLLLQFGSYVSFFDTGMQTTIARYVGRATGLGDREYLKRVLASSLAMLAIGAGLATLCTMAAAVGIAKIFPRIPASLQPDAARALSIIGCSLALSLPFTTLIGGFLGLQRNRTVTLGVVCGKLLSAAGMAWTAQRGGGLVALAAWFAVGALAPPVVYVIEWVRQRDDLPLAPQLAELPLIRELAAFYVVLAANTMAFILISGLDIPIVAALDFPAVSVYSLATVFGNMLLIPQGAIVSVVMPAAAGITAQRDPAEVGAALHKFVRYASISLCAIASALALSAPVFLRFWLGPQLATAVLPFALTLLAAQCLTLTAHPYRTMTLATGEQRKLLPAQFIEAGVNVVCSLVLARRLGAVGVAIGTLIGSAAAIVAQFFVSMPRTGGIRIPRSQYLRASLLEPAIACAPTAFLLVALWQLHWKLSWSAAFAYVGTALTGTILLNRTFNAAERADILLTLRRKLRTVPLRS